MNRLHDIKCFCLDMDGTIYLSDVLFKGALAAVERMQRQGRVIFLTNNSSRTRDEYYHKLNKLGFKITPDDIYGSGNATIDYLNTYYYGKSVYLMGCQPLIAEFKAAGINICNDYASSSLGAEYIATNQFVKANATIQNFSGSYDNRLAGSNTDCTLEANFDAVKNKGENSTHNCDKFDVAAATKGNAVKNKGENSTCNCSRVDVAVDPKGDVVKNKGENSTSNCSKVDVAVDPKGDVVKNMGENSTSNCSRVDVAVVAFDKTLTYKKLEDFCRHLDNGAVFIATHPDKTCPTTDGYIPDVGSFLRLIKCVTGRSPNVVCGKPSKEYGKRIVGKTGFKANQIAMVGDRLSTDMRFAYNSGFRSVLVLSGETKQADLQRLAADKRRLPDIVLNSISEWDK